MCVMTSIGEMSPARMQILQDASCHATNLTLWHQHCSETCSHFRRAMCFREPSCIISVCQQFAGGSPLEPFADALDYLLRASLGLLALGGLLRQLEHLLGHLLVCQRVRYGYQEGASLLDNLLRHCILQREDTFRHTRYLVAGLSCMLRSVQGLCPVLSHSPET